MLRCEDLRYGVFKEDDFTEVVAKNTQELIERLFSNDREVYQEARRTAEEILQCLVT